MFEVDTSIQVGCKPFVAISYSEEYKRQTLRLFGITAAGTMRDQVLGPGLRLDGREVDTVAFKSLLMGKRGGAAGARGRSFGSTRSLSSCMFAYAAFTNEIKVMW